MPEEQTETMQDVFSYIVSEEKAYQLPVTIFEGYEWSMAKHIKLSLLYPLSQFESGNPDDRPFAQIIQPILNLQHRSEGFDVKDILIYVDNFKEYYKSFLIKKYHDKWVRENSLDNVIDDSVESYCDMGLSLIKDSGGETPESVPLQRLAFCDQTDILSGPICEKHNFAPDQLKEMEKNNWGNEKYGANVTIDELITLSGSFKNIKSINTTAKTPGKYVEVYELHGMFPEWWLKGEEGTDNKYTRQLHIVAFYQKSGGEKKGLCLFKGPEEELIYTLEKRTPKVYGRAVGVGGAEELFEPQVWTNYDAIRMKELLDAGSKIIFQTADESFKTKNNLKNLDNMSVLTHDANMPLTQVDTTPRNIRLFENSIMEWDNRAKTIASAQEAIMGKSPSAGTPFKLQELITAEAHGMHEYRKGKMATFWESIYRKSIIPKIVKEINEGEEFLEELDLDEMQSIADAIAKNQAEKILKEKVLNGGTIEEGEREALKEKIKNGFMGSGNKKLIEIIKDELKNAPVDVKINIAGKQKDIAGVTDKLVNVLRFMLQTYDPNTKTFTVFNDQRMMKLFKNIIEYSGLSPMDFYAPEQKVEQQMTAPQIPQGQGAEELKALAI